MINLIFLQTAIGLSLFQSEVQDSSLAILQQEIYRIDSCIRSVEKEHKLEKKTIIGASEFRNQYKGNSFLNLKKKTLDKLIIITVSTGMADTVYVSDGKVFKIIQGTQEYYSINKSYYTRQLTKVDSPILLADFYDLEAITRQINTVLTSQKSQ